MKNDEKIDNIHADLDIQSFSDILGNFKAHACSPYSYFVFVQPNESILDALHYHIIDPDNIGRSLAQARKNLPAFMPDSVYAVFIHDQGTDRYIYYKTIKYRRASYALLSDSE